MMIPHEWNVHKTGLFYIPVKKAAGFLFIVEERVKIRLGKYFKEDFHDAFRAAELVQVIMEDSNFH